MREITQIFLSRAELVPAGETTEEHRILQQDEAQIVELDKARNTASGGGLFNGRFSYFPRRRAPVIRDIQDGVDRCPNCTWELEEGECGSCGYPHVTDDMGSLSGSLSEGNSYLEDEILARHMVDERRGLLGLEDGGSDMGYSSGSDVSFADYVNRRYDGIDAEELAAMGRIAARGRNRGRVLTETDDEHSSADDEDAGSLDGFVVNDAEEGPNSRAREISIHDDWTSAYGMSPRSRSSHIGSRSTHYDTDEVNGIDENRGTYPSDDDGSLNERSLSQTGINRQNRDTTLGPGRSRQIRARARLMLENSGRNQTDRGNPSTFRGSSHERSEDGSDDAPIVRTRRRARLQRLSSSSCSDIANSGTSTFRRPSLSRRTRQRTSNDSSAHGFSPPHPNSVSNERGSGSGNGISRGAPIEIASDSDPPVPPRRSSTWRTVNHNVFDDGQTSTADAVNGRTPSSQSSIGTATVGQQSPVQDTPNLPPGLRRNPISPILIDSSPVRAEEAQDGRLANNHPIVSPSASTNSQYRSAFHIDIPPRNSPRPRQRTPRIPSRSPRQPPGNSSSATLPSGSSHHMPRQTPATEALSGAEQRQLQAANDEAARKAARKAEKKRLKRERRQREQNQTAANTIIGGGDAFDRRW